jgi:hypothetical protein
MHIANLALRFVVELLGIASVAYAAFQISDNALVRVLATVAAPLLLIVAWAMLVAPNTANGLSQPQKDIIGTVLLLLAAAALGVAGQVRLAVILAAVVLANAGLLFAFGNDAAPALNRAAR